MTSVVRRERSRVQAPFCVSIRVPLDTTRYPENRGFSHSLRLYKILETREIPFPRGETHFAYKVEKI